MAEAIKEKKLSKKIMNEEIKRHPVYVLNILGQLIPAAWIKSTDDYDHSQFNLHHFIEFQHYKKHSDWYEKQGIKQKLILIRIKTHEQLHFIAIKNLTDEEFEKRYRISRWDLIYSRKHTKRK
jgi:hypothetical protein